MFRPAKNGVNSRDEFERIAWLRQVIVRAEFQAELIKAIGSLPEREKLVMSLYYERELNLKEIGKVLDVSESRVCQIHSQLKRTLKTQLSEDALLFSAVG